MINPPHRSLQMLRTVRWWTWLAALFLLLGLAYAVYCHATSTILPYDDAYITFRYIKDLFAGHGLVYNPGQRVFGSSTPLYVAWLVLLKALFPAADVPELAVRGNAVLYVGAILSICALVAHLTRRGWWGMFVGAIISVTPFYLGISLGGMESYLFVALSMASLWTFVSGRVAPSAVLVGLASVSRPEGVLLAAVWSIAWLAYGRPGGWRAVWLAAVGPVVWTAFATIYYGSPVPQSVIAKSAPLYQTPPLSACAELVALFTVTAGLARPGFGVARMLYSAEAVTLGAWGLARCRRVRQRGGWIVAAAFAFLCAFYILTNPCMFEWYFPGLWGYWVVCVSVGIPALLARQREPAPPRSHYAAAGLAIATAVLLVAPVRGLWDMGALDWPKTGAQHSAMALRVYAYRDVAGWLNGTVTVGAVVAAPEIGALGYYYDGPILDACALVSPEALPYLPVPADECHPALSGGAIGSQLVRDLRPEYVVTMPIFAEMSLGRAAWFADEYALIYAAPLPRRLWGSDEVLVYARTSPW